MTLNVGSRAITTKVLVWAVICASSWGLEKVLDHFYDLSIFSSLWRAVVSTYEWSLQSTPFPLWLFGLMALLIVVAFCVAFYYYRVAQEAFTDLNTVEAILTDLKQPKPAPITDDQLMILKVIAEFIERQTFPNFRQLKEHLEFSHLRTEAATDVLHDKGLIEWGNRFGVAQARLTPAGRALLTNPNNQNK